MPNIADISGQQFSRLTAIEIDPQRSGRRKVWRCQCECGSTVFAQVGQLRFGKVRSCGCLKLDLLRERSTTHGESVRTREYEAWAGMRKRCFDQNSADWPAYGGRGITICLRWDSFETFLADMGRKPSSVHSLDRRDVNGPYAPTNCRWATPKEQATNRRNKRTFTHQGQTLNLIEWQDVVGIHWRTLRSRITQMGWSVEDALTKPLQRIS